MGLPRKKSRPIEVGGQSFRWLRKGSHRTMGATSGVQSITVQHEDGGRVLQADLICTAPNIADDVFSRADYVPNGMASEVGESRIAIGVKPGMIARLIEAALEDGWKPDDPARSPFVFVRDLDLGDYKVLGERET